MQDSHTEQLNNLHQDHEKEAAFVKTLLSTSIESLQSCSAVMEKIRSVATARFCLQIIAKHLKECYSLNTKSNSDVYEELFGMAAVLCDLPIKHIRSILTKIPSKSFFFFKDTFLKEFLLISEYFFLLTSVDHTDLICISHS